MLIFFSKNEVIGLSIYNNKNVIDNIIHIGKNKMTRIYIPVKQIIKPFHATLSVKFHYCNIYIKIYPCLCFLKGNKRDRNKFLCKCFAMKIHRSATQLHSMFFEISNLLVLLCNDYKRYIAT